MQSQEWDIQKEYYNVKDGLSHRMCRYLVEDDLGNLWIGNQLGIDRFNGYDFQSFNHTNSILLKNPVVNMFKDQNGMIWIIQQELILSQVTEALNPNLKINITMLDPVDLQFMPADSIIFKGERAEEKKITNISQRKDKIYLRTTEGENYIYDSSLKRVSNHEKIKFTITSDNYLFYEHEDSVYVRNTTGATRSYPIDRDSLAWGAQIDKKGNLYRPSKPFCNPPFVTKINFEGVTKVRLPFVESVPKNNSGNNYFRINPDADFNDFIKFNNQVFIRGRNVCKILEIDDCSFYSSCISKKNDLIYLGSKDGLFILRIKPKKFRTMYNDHKQLYGFRGIYQDDNVFIAENYKEVIVQKYENETAIQYFDCKPSGGLFNYKDPVDNSLWRLFHGTIMQKLDLESFSCQSYGTDFPEVTSFHSILRSQNSGNLLVGSTAGILHYDEASNSFKIRQQLPNKKGEAVSYINHMTENDSIIWLATSDRLMSYNEIDGQLSTSYFVNDTLQEAEPSFLHFESGKDDVLWIGTKYKGLVRWDRSNNDIQTFSETNLLSDNTVHAIYQDNNNGIWITTNQNLNRLNIQTFKNSVYTLADGLSDTEFNAYSHFQSDQGYLYFGGQYGITYFHPDSIPEPQTIETSIRIDRAFITGSRFKQNLLFSEYYDKTIVIPSQNAALNLTLATDYLFETNRVIYQYRISDIENHWVNITGNQLRLANLPYGTHLLEIRIDPTQSSLSSPILTQSILIPTPFVKSLFFKLGVVLLIILLGLLYYKFRIRQLERRAATLEAVVNERTQELSRSNQTKNRLFAILAHDLKNPIISLNGIVDKIKYLIRKNRVSEIDDLTEDIQRKINGLDHNLANLLHWALVEEGSIPHQPRQNNLFRIIESILDMYNDKIAGKQLSIINKTPQDTVVFADMTALQTILRNVLQNAIKFSFDKSRIFIQTETSDSDFVELSVISKGPDVNHSKASDRGLGLGLTIISELVKINNGEFRLSIDDQTMETTASIIFPKVASE